ncbi:MAG TPA: hypothetical protein G4N92_01680 [Anaerolineae bacterium]|nr:hypothetical protein [Anaerolineae bacterium]
MTEVRQQENSVVFSMRFSQAILEGIVEILGFADTRTILEKAYIPLEGDDFSKVKFLKGLDQNQLNDFSEALEKRYGKRSGNGILWKIGEATLHYLRNNFEEIQLVGSLEQRIAPFQQKMQSGLDALATLLANQTKSNVLAQDIEKNHWEFSLESNWLIAADCEVRWCFFVRGLLVALLEWLDNRKNYTVEELQCTARGDYACVFNITASVMD